MYSLFNIFVVVESRCTQRYINEAFFVLLEKERDYTEKSSQIPNSTENLHLRYYVSEGNPASGGPS